MSMRNLRAFSLSLLSLLIFLSANAQQNPSPAEFLTPPASSKPGAYWYWLNGNISKEGVVKDLQSMAEVGIGRAFIGNIGLDGVPQGPIKMFTPAWWEVIHETMKAGGQTGVDIGMFNSPGWSQSGGPWVKPTETMRYLATDETTVSGSKNITLKKPAAEYWQDVAVLAFPAQQSTELATLKHTITANLPVTNLNALADGDMNTAATFSEQVVNNKGVTIDISTPGGMEAQSLLIYPAHQALTASAELQAETGTGYVSVKKFKIVRYNSMLTVGFIPYAPVSVAFPKIKAANFRLILSGIEGGSSGIKELKLSNTPYLESYAEKQLAKMFQSPLPLWNEYQWPTQPETGGYINPGKIINLTALLNNGTLNWKVPPGKWTIVRYGMLPTGVTNSPAPAEGTGFEVDKINSAALLNLYNSFIGEVIKRVPAADRTSFKYVVADSYETGSQNWTDGMAETFKKQFGYDPLPWLPVLAGRVVQSADASDRFLWDLRRLVADKVAYEYVGGLRELCHKNNLSLWLENYGHWGYPSEFLKYGGQADEVGGEFWNEGDLGSIECKAASSAAHIYGKNKVSAESFTAGYFTYGRHPALLKKRGDWSFTEGINNTILHVYIQQPYADKVPGINAGFGTEFNRHNTWFKQGKAFIDYLRRCNHVLQQGIPVNDVAYFIGEDAPKMTGTRDPELPKGYGYDYINAEVIENRLAVKNGRLTLPEGISYRLLVLPKLETMRPELLKKLKELVAAGAVVLGPKPLRSPSLQNFGKADAEVKAIAGELWGNADGINVKQHQYGKGMVLCGYTMEEAFKLINLKADFSVAQTAPVLYTHRETPEADIYFVTNQSDSTIHIDPQFRVAGRQPEWWDAVTGETRLLPEFSVADSLTTVPLKLDGAQSGFVVFTDKVVKRAPRQKNFPALKQLLTVNTPWLVAFDKAFDGPAEPVVFKELTDWTKNTDDRIKYYSGTAVYKTTFKASAVKNKKMSIDIGKVGVMAKIKLNGKELGTVWTAPYRVDITGAVKAGKNELEIEVVNTWINRLIGDAGLPEDKRLTWLNINPYKTGDGLVPAGLTGPVTVITEE